MRPVNLLPEGQRRAVASGSQRGSAYVVVGVLGVLLAMVVAYVFTANNVSSRQTEAAKAGAQADRLEAQAEQLGSFTNFAQIKQTRLASVSGTAAGRFDWERMMRELSLIMPSGSWLQSTDASVTGQVEGADTTTPTGTPATPHPTADLVGCTPRQSDVARMMVRMRQMHRVTDVKLKESSREQDTSGEAGAESCGHNYNFDLVVTFSDLPVPNEVPRGAIRVPASLGGGS